MKKQLLFQGVQKTTKTILLMQILFVVVSFGFGGPASYAQSVSGTVKDDVGVPLPGVNVLEKGTSNGTTTDAEGKYMISVSTDATLVFSFIGFKAQEVMIGGKTVIDITMVTDIESLDEVVVVGYGTVQKSDLTGAVSNIGTKDFNQGAITNPIQQIQGKVPGLVITTSSGDPNANPSIRLRGQTSLTGGQSPLIVVDGIPLDNVDQLSNILPGDIASYDVLKDASATSIYGSRGANGVIIVTTKKGKSGATKIDYAAFAAIDNQAKYYDLLSGDEWRAANPGGVGSQFDNGANTDWQKAITRTARTQSHTVSVSGGSEGFTYVGSVNYLNQEGIIRNSGKEQVGFRFNLQQKAINDRLVLSLGATTTQTDRQRVADFTNPRMQTTSPALSVFNPDGTYNAFSFGLGRQNPVQGVDLSVNNEKEYLTLLSGSADFEIIKNLKVGAVGSITHFNSQGRSFKPSNINGDPLNSATQSSGNRNFYRGDLHLSYLKEFGKHTVDFTGVYEYNLFASDGFDATGKDFSIPFFRENNLGTGDLARQTMSSAREEFKIISFLGRANYNYDNKYYLTASLRRDGSTKFGVNNRWGIFPAVTAAWRISKESFLQSVTWISDLKIRAGYGETGNSEGISPYSSFLTYGKLEQPVFDPITNSFIAAYAPNQNPNPNLKWERRIGRNIGIDFGFLDNRLTGDFNIFSDKTEDLLFNYLVPSPPFFILPPRDGNPQGAYVLANVGSLTNNGVELALNFRAINKNKFSWTVGGQISTVDTKITSLSGNFAGFNIPDTTAAAGRLPGVSSIALTYLKAGYNPYVFFIPTYAGVNAQGEQLFTSEVDVGGGNRANQNLTITQNPDPDRRFINPAPSYTFGFTNTLTYSNWSFNFFLRGVVGQKAYNTVLASLESDVQTRLVGGQNVTRAALTNGIRDRQLISDLWLEDASFIRLDNATLAYTFNNLKGIKNLRLFVGANNLFVITSFRGLDPEIQVTTSTNNNNAYIANDDTTPRTRSFSIGLNASF
jgi:TonB-dependent starch-binding outer membrane protein SusC